MSIRIQQDAEPAAAARRTAERKYNGEEGTRPSKGRKRRVQANRTRTREARLVRSQAERRETHGLYQI